MNPFDVEQLLLSHIITFGNDAARVCLPQLTHDKFVFSSNGAFGMGHALMWAEIRRAYLKDNLSPILSVLKDYFNNDELAYANQLPKADTFDPLFIEQLATKVDENGLVYNIALHGNRLGHIIQSTEAFAQAVETIADKETWATHQLNDLRQHTSMQSEGYEHIASVAERVRQEWDAIRSGKKQPFIESGWPSLKTYYLFPAGQLAIIHGPSSGGKTTFVLQVLLGTAMHLYVNDLPGCVAFNSLEMTAESLTERLASILARVNLKQLKTGEMSKEDYERLVKWTYFVEQLPIFVDDTNFLTTTAMQYRVTGLHVSEHGPVIQLGTDYSELFADDEDTKEQRVNKVFREQLAISRMIGTSVLAISQSTVDTSISGKTQIAGAGGIRYSKGGLQAADIVCELWNPIQLEAMNMPVILGKDSKVSKENPYLFIQKHRHAAAGEHIKLGWIPKHTTFFDTAFPQSIGKETLYSHLDSAAQKWKGQTGSW